MLRDPKHPVTPGYITDDVSILQSDGPKVNDPGKRTDDGEFDMHFWKVVREPSWPENSSGQNEMFGAGE